MPSDRSRTSDDLRQHYQAVVTQQGRVILDRDFNALQGIVDGRITADARDEIGPCGTPDNGFAISLPTDFSHPAVSVSFSRPNPWDFLISPGTMYVGGQRVVLEAPRPSQPAWSYFHQPDWLAPDDPTGFGSVSFSTPGHESVYLRVFEQEVGAVEDPDLLDVALGGPDTTQRVRLMKRIERLAVNGTDCASALTEVQADWLAQGFAFDPATMRLIPQVKLQVSFAAATTAVNPCDPVTQGGYLGAENQLVRLQITDSVTNGQARLLWGYDNASFLYRVSVQPDGKTLLLNQTPVDAFHSPKPGQVVEVLRTVALLDSTPPVVGATGQVSITRCIANATGQVATVEAFNNGETLVLTTPLPSAYLTDSNQLFLRVWQGLQTFDPLANQPIVLKDPTSQSSPGVQVTVTSPGIGASLPVGAFWMFALRPSTPQAVYPQRFLVEPQPPDGPRQWLCPLAVIEWQQATSGSIPVSISAPSAVHDCRQSFENLVTLSMRQSGGCCTLTVFPSDAPKLQTLLDQAVIGGRQVTICFTPGTYSLPQPLRLISAHSHLTLEACQGDVILQADPNANAAQFAGGLVVMVGADNVTFQGLTIVPTSVPLTTTLDKLNVMVLVGLRSANCVFLTLANCNVQFPALVVSPNEFVFGAGMFLAGDCTGLTVRNCQFGSQIPLTSTYVPANQPVNPSGIAAGKDGKIWFTVQGPPAKVGMIDPKTHQISLFPIPTPGSFPQGLVAAPDGSLWFIETQPMQIARFNPTTHQVDEFPFQGNLLDLTIDRSGNVWMRNTSGNTVVTINATTHVISAYSPVTAGSSPQGIAIGPDGNVWFTETSGKIGMINPSTFTISEFAIPTANVGPGKIVAGPNINLYFLETLGNKIGSINTNTKQVVEVATPTTPSFPSDLVVGPDGNIWFVEGEGKLGMLNITTQQITEFTPTANSFPNTIVRAPDGNLWFFETGTPNRIGSINPGTKQISEILVPTANSGLGGLMTGPDGNLWFYESYSGQIATVNLQTRTISEFPIFASAPSVVAISGIIALPNIGIGRVRIIRDIPFMDEVSIRDNRFSNLTLPVFVEAALGSCRLQNNTVIGCFSGFSLQTSGSAQTANLSEALTFSEIQLTTNLGVTYELPDGFHRIFHTSAPRLSLIVSNNSIGTQPSDPSTYSTAAVLIAAYRTPRSDASVVISANDVNARTPMLNHFGATAIPTVVVGTNVAATLTGNVFVNVTPNNNHIDNGQSFCLVIVLDSTGSTAGLSVTGNVLVGKSNLPSLVRTDAAAPLNTWTPFNSTNG
jgi:streptogramin lyase